MKTPLIAAMLALLCLSVPAQAQDQDPLAAPVTQSEAPLAAPPPQRGDVVITANPCKKRLRKGCWTARQVTKYGVENFWEVIYVVVDEKWILAESAQYGVDVDEACGRKGYAYLKSVTPVVERRVMEVLTAAQDIKEQCELDKIRADGLEAVNAALQLQAKSLDDFHVLRLPKRDLNIAPPQAQEMLRPWIE